MNPKDSESAAPISYMNSPIPSDTPSSPYTLSSQHPKTPIDSKFTPHDPSSAPILSSGLSSSNWSLIQSAPATFLPEHFLAVSSNLLENPNLTASHLARAEISYQSFNDATFHPDAQAPEDLARIIKHLRPECRPRLVHDDPEGGRIGLEGYELEWTVVRKLVPRNPKLDASMMQTCHLYTSTQPISITYPDGTLPRTNVKAERYLVVYIPHVSSPDEIPFYHPQVRRLAIGYTYIPPSTTSTPPLPSSAILNLYYTFFPSTPLNLRLSRTALSLLSTIHKHARGRAAGYKKRVHHDVVVPRKAFQDRYAYLKGKYAKQLIEGWVEQTPPEKHVFEDLGIAAFVDVLWGIMYGADTAEGYGTGGVGDFEDEEREEAHNTARRAVIQAAFPGFVDIGCGNGLLVHILLSEGWRGWGFDARRRKTWDTFPSSTTSQLKEFLLVPSLLSPPPFPKDDDSPSITPQLHPGVFPQSTFLISNHADHLTPWTPLLASLSCSPFLAIPCCSHDFGGTRFRAPTHSKYVSVDPNAKIEKNGKQPSAWTSLCSWVCHLTEETGYVVEREYLRIPSTRNVAILGRRRMDGSEESSYEEKVRAARELVEKEMGKETTIEQVHLVWMRNGGVLLRSKGGH